MILSIGMIVRNEEKYLDRCLNALTPVLKQLDSELIIADTGSDDHTIEIAGKFTPQVFHFDWCNDFAAARNSVMKKAKGTWFMTIDADEIFENTDALIQFFKSGEYEKFNSATFVVRSANDAGLKEWSDFNALRLIKLKKDSYYVNAVHEQFGRIYAPIKCLSSVAYHYGYVVENNEEALDHKLKRNMIIMQSELEKDPTNGILYLNIANALKIQRKFEDALEYSRKGLTHALKRNDPVRFSLYASMIAIYIDLDDYSKAIEISNEYFGSKQNKIGTDLEVYFLLALANHRLFRYQDAITAYQNYLDSFAAFRKGLYNTIDTIQHSIAYTNDSSYRTAVLCLAASLFEENNYTDAQTYLNTLSVKDLVNDQPNIASYIKLKWCIMEKLCTFSGIAELDNQLGDASSEILHGYIEHGLNRDEYRDLILKEFSSSSCVNSPYGKLMTIRYQYAQHSLSPGLIQDFMSNTDQWTPQYADILYFTVIAGLPIQAIVQAVDPADIEAFFFRNPCFHFPEMPCYIAQICQELDGTEDARTQIWLSSLFLCELTSGRIREEKIEEIFKAYAKTSSAALTALFKNAILTEENIDLIPQEYRVGFYSYLAVNSLESGQKHKYIKYLRAALKLNPALNQVIKSLADEFENRMNETAERSSELEAYAAMAKKAINELIDMGKINEAAQFLKTYESVYPADAEIEELKKRIAFIEA